MRGSPLDDVSKETAYADLMVAGTPFIELRICLEKPPELFQLINAFVSVGNQFDEYIRSAHPALEGHARLFVKEIRQGSTIVELIPVLAPLIANMDAVLIVDNFVTRYGGMLKSFIGGTPAPAIPKSDVKDFLGAVEVVANDSNGRSIISSATYHETKTTKRIEIEFTTPEAKQAQSLLERMTIDIDTPVYEEKENVLMVFWQSNVADPAAGKKTGERVVIEVIHRKPLAIKYETDEVRQRIKYETREDEGNIFKKGFFVDCKVERLRGRPVAYRITAVHDVIDLPEDEEGSGERLV